MQAYERAVELRKIDAQTGWSMAHMAAIYARLRNGEAAMECLRNHEIDFAFVYFGYPDAAGHKRGWLSDAYMDAVHKSWENIEKIVAALPEDYVVIVTADHGGSGRDHGKDVPEDMTIPIFIFGKDIEKGKEIFGANIIDIAPTITKLFGVKPDEDWEGKSLI